MSIRALDWAFRNATVATPAERLILLALADHADDDGFDIFPAQGTLVAKTRLARRTIQRGLVNLETAGIIERTGVRPRTGIVIYRIVDLCPQGRQDDARQDDAPAPSEAEGGVTVTQGGRHHDAQTVIEPPEPSTTTRGVDGSLGATVAHLERAVELWTSMRPSLVARCGEVNFDIWLSDAEPRGLTDDTLILAVDVDRRSWIADRWEEALAETASAAAGRELKVMLLAMDEPEGRRPVT